ncbi:MAG: universal stress protein [bacterium]|nr:universal stress protein [bacterium]
MKTILVPTDFSKNAENALRYAVDIAKRENAHIVLLHACQTNYSNTDIPYFEIGDEISKTRKDSDKYLHELSRKYIHGENVAYETLSMDEFPIDAVLRIVQEKEVDLIVMGTKGASGIIGTIFGSNTALVIEKVKCPVLAIPEASTFHEIKKITYATSYIKSDFECLRKVIEIAEPFKAHLNIVHITDRRNSHEEERRRMDQFIEEVKVKVPYWNLTCELIYDEDTEQALKNYMDKDPSGLLVMSTHHRDFFDKIFGKSYTQQMAYHTKTPLLAFHH